MNDKLMHLPEKSRKTVIKFAESLIEAFDNNLYSLILFGSAARASRRGGADEFKEGASDINTVIILESVAKNELNVILDIGRKFKKSGLALPLVFKRGHIPTSLDTFPLEFSDMKHNHIILHGADPLEEAVIETSNLRYQCEVQFKGQLVQLRRGYLASGEDSEMLTQLISGSVSSIMAACRGMVWMSGKTPPDMAPDLLKLVHNDYKVDTEPIAHAWRVKHGDAEESTASLENLFDEYMKSIEKLADVVDGM
ncbi:MAG: hypothetical protein J7K40_06960 [candidate division Zixibacteria bacterium]|nr:hypothetical protein [candidate division Zixibacteria bacterium]